MAHEFLSDAWFEAVQALDAPPPPAVMNGVVINLVVTREGGENVEAPTKLTVPYTVARQMFVEGNQQAAMQAFMSGQIKVEGDMTKLMAMQSGGGTPDPAAAAAMQAKLKEITSDFD